MMYYYSMDRISLQLPPKVLQQVKALAARKGLSLAAYIRMVVIKDLKEAK